MQKNLLMVVSSTANFPSSGERTGFYYAELTTPYYIFTDAGISVDIASLKGKTPPHDPNSLAELAEKRPSSVQRFLEDKKAMAKLSNSLPLSQVRAEEYNAIFLVGGHGAMFDFPENYDLAQIISTIYAHNGIVASICHGAAGLIPALKNDGSPLVKGLHINSFTNEEERRTGKDTSLPFLLENKLREMGAIFESCMPFDLCVVEDKRVITGQNPASAEGLATRIVTLLQQEGKQSSAA